MSAKWINYLTQLADAADDIALHYFKSAQLQVDTKKDFTPVSEGDIAIEKAIREITEKERPGVTVMGEEFGVAEETTDTILILDPIDGTKNFIAGIPFFATLMAIEQKGKIVAGMVSSAATGDRWWAERGIGSFHNAVRLHVSSEDKLEKSMAFHASIYGSEATDQPEKMLALLKKTYRQRGFGDYLPHMMVAMGCGEFAMDYKLKPWDMAPLKIIVEEAGGKFSDVNGVNTIESGNLITSNGKFHDLLVEHLKGTF